MVDYAQLIEQAIGPMDLWLSAYNNDVFGYLPSARPSPKVATKPGASSMAVRGSFAGGAGRRRQESEGAGRESRPRGLALESAPSELPHDDEGDQIAEP